MLQYIATPLLWLMSLVAFAAALIVMCLLAYFWIVQARFTMLPSAILCVGIALFAIAFILDSAASDLITNTKTYMPIAGLDNTVAIENGDNITPTVQWLLLALAAGLLFGVARHFRAYQNQRLIDLNDCTSPGPRATIENVKPQSLLETEHHQDGHDSRRKVTTMEPRVLRPRPHTKKPETGWS